MKPFVTCCPDYHDFEWIKFAFKQVGANLIYREIGCFKSDLIESSFGLYHAVFFRPEDKDSQEVKDLITTYNDYKSTFFY